MTPSSHILSAHSCRLCKQATKLCNNARILIRSSNNHIHRISTKPPRVCIWFHLVVLDAEARSLVREQGGIDFSRVKRSKGTGEWLSHRYEDLDSRPRVLQ